MPDFPKIASFRDVASFRARLRELDLDLPCDETLLAAPASPLAAPLQVAGRTVGNRFAVQPMEGWDGTESGEPSDFTVRRWQRFGSSGAKLIWGGEAVAVLPEGRANPNQLLLNEQTAPSLGRLRETLVRAHHERFGETHNLLIGLQLTHSGRFCRPFRKDRLEPRILYHHPILDARFGSPGDERILSDEEIERIIAAYGRAAALAQRIGFDFVDLKHCHGYLGHEFLSAVDRPGPYGGSLENRSRFLRECAAAVREAAPGTEIGVRLSAFDLVPFRPDLVRSTPAEPGPGIPEETGALLPYRWGFGADPGQPDELDLDEPMRFVAMLDELGIQLLNVTGGSPYYNPHVQRPARFPPSDGYQPPEDPLVGVARQVAAAAAIKRRFPGLLVVGSAYSYLQEYVAHVGQAVVRAGRADFIGLGRMALSYPDLPRDVLEQGRLNHRLLCRTFSDCTTAPRSGMVSGCYPLDPFYRDSPLNVELKAIKRGKPAPGGDRGIME